MIRSSDPVVIDPFRGLTAKQCQVLDLLIEHKTSKEISRLLGISPHTVDQRIMLARAKLQVATRNEVAQAYRLLLAQQSIIPQPAIYEQSVYGSPDVAISVQIGQEFDQEATEITGFGVKHASADRADAVQQTKAPLRSVDPANRYYHVLPEAFDGRVGTLLRLGAILMIAVFLTLIILGGLAIYSELAHLLDN